MTKFNDPDSALILESSLQSFFYTELQEINEKLVGPLPRETIFYSSLVMDKFGDAQKYFEVVEGKVRNKTLGVMLLEAAKISGEAKQSKLTDIGDTALLICGYFS